MFKCAYYEIYFNRGFSRAVSVVKTNYLVNKLRIVVYVLFVTCCELIKQYCVVFIACFPEKYCSYTLPLILPVARSLSLLHVGLDSLLLPVYAASFTPLNISFMYLVHSF